MSYPQLIHISFGGPEFYIQVRGKTYRFEWHHYCGPIVLGARGESLARQPGKVLFAAGQWHKQGRRMEGAFCWRCRWDYEPQMLTEQIKGRHYKVLGMAPARRGE